MTDNVSPIIQELRRAYTSITDLWPNPLPMPVINTPNKDRRRKGWSWYTPDSWESEGSDILNAFVGAEGEVESKSEVCIAAEALGMDHTTLLTELTHQVVHHINYVTRQKDTSCGLNYDGKPIDNPVSIEGFYHNRWFVDTCNALGLLMPRYKDGEWSFTLSDQLSGVFATIDLDKGVFDLNRRGVMLTRETRSGLRLYECGHGQKIRAATDYLDAHCGKCGSPFIYADKNADASQRRMLEEVRGEYGT